MMVAEHSWLAVCLQKQVGTSILVAFPGEAWSRKSAEDTEVSAEICANMAHGWLRLLADREPGF